MKIYNNTIQDNDMNTNINNELRPDLVWEEIRGQCVSKKNNYTVGNNKHGERYIVKTQRLKDYERSFVDQCTIYKDRNIDKPFKLWVIVYESSNSYDLDNSLGSILDGLQYAKAIRNDNQCIEIYSRKVIDPINPRVRFAIEELEPTFF